MIKWVKLFVLIGCIQVFGSHNILAQKSGSVKSVQEAKKPDIIDIRLVTFSPYSEIFTWFGHTAIEIRNNQTGKAYMYSFGGFMFDMENLLKFSLGRFVFWNYVQESQAFLHSYRREGRHIVYQTLNLTHAQKLKIRKRLINYMRPENRTYLYDHFLDNCSTRVRDIIDEALDGKLKEQTSETADLTFRDYVHRMTSNVPQVDFPVLFFLNDTMDKPISRWDTMFLPDRLMVEIQRAKNPDRQINGDNSLVSQRIEENAWKKTTFYNEKAEKSDTRFYQYLVGIVLFLVFGVTAYYYLKKSQWGKVFYVGFVSLFGLIFGSLGLMLFLMMFFTDHKDTYGNENILLLNPLTFLLLPIGILHIFGKGKQIFTWTTVLCGGLALLGTILKILPVFDQVNAQQLRVILPTLFIFGITGLLELKNKKEKQ